MRHGKGSCGAPHRSRRGAAASRRHRRSRRNRRTGRRATASVQPKRGRGRHRSLCNSVRGGRRGRPRCGRAGEGGGAASSAPRSRVPDGSEAAVGHSRSAYSQQTANKMHFPKIFACVRAARRCRVPTRRRTKGSARPGPPPNREGGPGEAARRGGRSHALFGIRKPLHDTLIRHPATPGAPSPERRGPGPRHEGWRTCRSKQGNGTAKVPRLDPARDESRGHRPGRAREGAARGRRISLWRV